MEQEEIIDDSNHMQIDEILPEISEDKSLNTKCIFDINPESKFFHQGIDRTSLAYKMETIYSSSATPSIKK
jgi:hypothetical protein